MNEIQLAVGVIKVTVYDAQENKPYRAIRAELLHTSEGGAIVYEQATDFEYLRVAGRVKTEAEVVLLGQWTDNGYQVTYTDRGGASSSGWRIDRQTPPIIRRKHGESADWLVDLRLRRLS